MDEETIRTSGDNVMLRVFRTVVKNLVTILLALLISVIVWFAVSLQLFPDVSDHITEIPVNVQPTEYMKRENLQISGSYQNSVSVQI